MAATSRVPTVPERRHVGVSLREAQAHSHLPVTFVYNSKRDAITALGISEWAATLTVFSVVLRRMLPRASRAPPAPLTTLHRVMDVVDSYTSLACSAYYFPRVELDGLPACRRRATAVDLQALAEKFFTQVNAACLRPELAVFGTYLDVPNTHRLRELVEHVVPALLHVRQAQELLFENSHQLLKRALVSGDGHDDASRAMARYVQSELAGRIRLGHAVFSIPDHWMVHAGLKASLDNAELLRSTAPGAWRCTGKSALSSDLSVAAVLVAEARSSEEGQVSWRTRATRGRQGRLRAGDAVRVLMFTGVARTAVRVTVGADARRLDSRPAYFRVLMFFTTGAGEAAAVVSPIEKAADGTYWALDDKRFLYLPLRAVRRALVLHDCQEDCVVSSTTVAHQDSNRWQALGRETGYPARSG